jgi:polyhydroxyalkanoate synthase
VAFRRLPGEARGDAGQLWEQSPVRARWACCRWKCCKAPSGASTRAHRRQVRAFAEPTGGKGRAFVTLEDWANDGPPLSDAAARELFEELLRGPTCPGAALAVGGQAIDPAALPCPFLNIVSTTDRIVPPPARPPASASSWRSAMSAWWSAAARAKAELWEPLAGWLSRGARLARAPRNLSGDPA